MAPKHRCVPPSHLTGPGMVARPGRAGAGALLPALGVQQQLALAALEGGFPEADAGAADTTWLGADHLERGSKVRAPLVAGTQHHPFIPPKTSPHCLHPSPGAGRAGVGGWRFAPHPLDLTPFSIAAKKMERGWGTHRFGGELVLEWREALWR